MSNDYKEMFDEDGEQIRCDSCEGYFPVSFKKCVNGTWEKYLCYLCSATGAHLRIASHLTMYQTMCFIGNEIISEINELKEKINNVSK